MIFYEVGILPREEAPPSAIRGNAFGIQAMQTCLANHSSCTNIALPYLRVVTSIGQDQSRLRDNPNKLVFLLHLL